MTTRAPSLKARAALAIALLIGFYVLALALAALLFWIPYAEWHYAHRIDARLLLFGVGGGLILLWSAIPKLDVFHEPGPRLEPAAQPRLFEMIHAVARQTGQAPPAEVYLIHDVNAWVAQRGGILGLGSRRIMGIGLPVMQTLDVSELEAVLAHEFGHFHGGDTKLGPFLYQTRAAIGRTIHGLGSAGGGISLLQKPFLAYGNLFLRVTQKISRAQESTADALAATLTGPTPLIEGLKKIEVAARAYDGYLNSEFSPVVGMGLLPPVGDGFDRFLRAPEIRRQVDELLSGVVETQRARAAAEDEKARQYESHPRLHERIDAIHAMGIAEKTPDTRPAIALLDDVSALDQALSRSMIRPDIVAVSQSVAWPDVARLGHIESYRRMIAEYTASLRGVHIGELATRHAEVAQSLLDAQRTGNRPGWNLEKDDRERWAYFTLGAAISVALADHGFTFTTAPGEAVLAHGPHGQLAPMELVDQLRAGGITAEEWQQRSAEFGIAEIMLLP